MTSGRRHRPRAGDFGGEPRPAPSARVSGPETTGRVLLLWGIVVFLVALLLFAPTLEHDFVWDDLSILLPNPALGDWSRLGEILTSDFFHESQDRGAADYWRPLVVLSHMVERSLFGDRAAGYHAVNVLLHALAALFVYLLGLRALARPAAALAGGLLFAVHPVHVEVVAWVSGRSDLLLGVFLAFALWTDWQAAWTGHRRWRLMSLLGFLAALLSKESAAVFPVLVAARVLLTGESHEGLGRRVSKAGRAALPALAVLGAYLWLRYGLLDVVPPQSAVDPADRLALFWTWWTALWLYARLLVWPTGLSIVHRLPLVAGPLSWAVVGGLSAFAAALWGTFRLRRAAPGAAFGILMLLSGLALLSNFVIPIASHGEAAFPVAERFLYAPSMGFCLLLGWLFGGAIPAALRRATGSGPGQAGDAGSVLRPRWRAGLGRAIPPALLGLALLVGGWSSAKRAADWKDEEALFGATLEAAPGSAMAQLNYGAALVDLARGEISANRRVALLERALPHLEAAVALAPVNYRGHYDLANLLQALGRSEDAEAAFLEALRLRPDLLQAMVNLGALLARGERPSEALEWFDRAQRLRPDHLAVMVNRAHVLQELGRADEAIPLYRQVLAVAPGLAAASAGLERALEAVAEEGEHGP